MKTKEVRHADIKTSTPESALVLGVTDDTVAILSVEVVMVGNIVCVDLRIDHVILTLPWLFIQCLEYTEKSESIPHTHRGCIHTAAQYSCQFMFGLLNMVLFSKAWNTMFSLSFWIKLSLNIYDLQINISKYKN